MMTSCPRCGFSQPEDQYCAQCGVNMLAFKPREKSAVKKLTENVAVQITALVLVAVVAGSFLIGHSPTSNFTKSERSSSLNRVVKPAAAPSSPEQKNETKENLPGLANQEIEITENATDSLAATQPSPSSALPTAPPHQVDPPAATRNSDTKETAADVASSGILFKLTYAEVSREVLQRWVADSSSLGLFQNLQEYSAGILPDFNKRGDKVLQYLKTTEKKLTLGQIETNVSGKMNDDGQVIGLSVNYELKSFDGIVHGALTIARNGRQSRDRFPAEFDLPKGSVFFLIDSITPQSLVPERPELNMAPFQIFKSQDFMTQNSKFVILIEPVVK